MKKFSFICLCMFFFCSCGKQNNASIIDNKIKFDSIEYAKYSKCTLNNRMIFIKDSLQGKRKERLIEYYILQRNKNDWFFQTIYDRARPRSFRYAYFIGGVNQNNSFFWNTDKEETNKLIYEEQFDLKLNNSKLHIVKFSCDSKTSENNVEFIKMNYYFSNLYGIIAIENEKYIYITINNSKFQTQAECLQVSNLLLNRINEIMCQKWR